MLAPFQSLSGQSEVLHHLCGSFQAHDWPKGILPLREDLVHLLLFRQVCQHPLPCLVEAHWEPCALFEVLQGQPSPWVVSLRLAFWDSSTQRFRGWLAGLVSLWAVEGDHSHSVAEFLPPAVCLPLEYQELSTELAGPGPLDEPWQAPWPGSA